MVTVGSGATHTVIGRAESLGACFPHPVGVFRLWTSFVLTGGKNVYGQRSLNRFRCARSKNPCGNRIGSLLFPASIAFSSRFTVPLDSPQPCALRPSAGKGFGSRLTEKSTLAFVSSTMRVTPHGLGHADAFEQCIAHFD
jgi:hypothetical protein